MALLSLGSRSLRSLRPVLPEGRAPAAWHAALSAEIAAGLGPDHARLLAAPAVSGDAIEWRTEGVDARPARDLPLSDQRLLDEAAAAILSDIRRLAESGAAPAVAAAWPALREVPDGACLHAVDGRPVLAAWGMVAAGAGAAPGLLRHLDDGLSWAPPPRAPWRAYAAVFGALALLALLAGLALPPLAGLAAGPQACPAEAGNLAVLLDQQREAQRRNALQGELSRLIEERGRRRLACPMPASPPRAADLPRDRWDRGDLAMLEGCWRSTTPMAIRDADTRAVSDAEAWQLCFDRAGGGEQRLRLTNGTGCRGPLRASFQGERMQFTETATCRGDFSLTYVGNWSCTRLNDREADCERREVGGQGNSRGRFTR